MRFFPQRDKNDQNSETNLPPELKEYYDDNGAQERTSVAWLLALASLIGTILIVMLVFFGGRWIYRQFHNHNKPSHTTTAQIPSNSSSKPSSSNQSAKTYPNNQAAPNSTNTNNQQKNLTNTGPSGTAAVFVITAGLGFSAYELRLRRKVKAS